MNLFKTSPLSLARTITAGAALATGVAQAHPGDHGHSFWQAVVHLLSEPDHLAGIAFVILITGYGVKRLRKASAGRAQRAERR